MPPHCGGGGMVRGVDEKLAAELHGDNDEAQIEEQGTNIVRPFSISNLAGAFHGGAPNPARIGAVGSVTYTSLSFDRYWMSVLAVLAVLAGFGVYCGVGAGITQGMGQCLHLPEPKRRPAS